MNFYQIIMIKYLNYLISQIKINKMIKNNQVDKQNKLVFIYYCLKKHYLFNHKNNN